MNSAAHDIAAFLATSGVGTLYGTTKWAINHNGEQIDPADTITVYDTGGPGPDTDELDIDQPSFQVRVRAVSLAEAYDKHVEISNLLIYAPVVAATSTFSLIVQTSRPVNLGRDDGNRHIMTANYTGRRTEEIS